MQELRWYQIAADKAVREALREATSAVVVMPTGGGKSTLFANWQMGSIRKGSYCIFLCHRRELVKQASDRLTLHGVPHGIIAAGYKFDRNNFVQVASIQSILPLLYPKDPDTAADIPRADVLVFDECHRATSKSYKKVIARYENAKVIGLTATPARTDGRGLGDIFEKMIEVVDVGRLMDEGYLCDYVIYEGDEPAPDSDLSMRGDDFDDEQAAARLDTDKLVGDVYANWKKHADGKRTIVFAQTRKHAKHIHSVFVAGGVRAAYLDGLTKTPDRDKIIALFSSGAIEVIVNVEVLVEGFDVPGIECIVLAFMTASIIKYRQAVGRGLRPSPGKTRLIINDHGGNAKHRFQGPDHPHQWSLDGRKKRAAPVQPSLTTCPVCRAGIRSTTRVCPECGQVLITVAPKTDLPDTTPGMLVEANYKIRGSEKAERAKSEAEAKRQREVERELKAMAKSALERQAAQELETQRKFLQEMVALAARKNYALDYPIKQFKSRFKSAEKKNGFWPGKKQGVQINWVSTGKLLPGTNRYAMKVAGFSIDGTVYGEMT